MEIKINELDAVQALSDEARFLWAKSPQLWERKETPENSWLPLYKHMNDSAEMARQLWKHWVSPATKKLIHEDLLVAEKLYVFFAASHDIGKATPEFQNKKTRDNLRQYVNLPIGSMSDPHAVPHSLAGHIILNFFLIDEFAFAQEQAESFAAVIGGHHGTSWSEDRIYDTEIGFPNNIGLKNDRWRAAQNELLEFSLALSGLDLSLFDDEGLDVRTQVILTGLVIMTDWLASNEGLFPYESLEYPREDASTDYAQRAWNSLCFHPRWVGQAAWSGKSAADFFRTRFDLPENAAPYPMQEDVVNLATEIHHPGIMVIEAPMGEGKTEAALLAAEIFAQRTDRSGLFFALPTQATTDGIFPRIIEWMDRLDSKNHAIFLAHGKSGFNEEYRSLEKIWMNLNVWDEDENGDGGRRIESTVRQHNASVHEWMQGRKTGILADFVIGTVDQILMGALKQKHLAMRHLGLADKVVIIDECHAYDAYMNQYLEGILGWLGMYGVPVIILSATLPSQKREALINAYLGQGKAKPSSRRTTLPVDAQNDTDKGRITQDWAYTRAYPLLTYSEGQEVHSVKPNPSERRTKVVLDFIDDDLKRLLDVLSELSSDGGCVGIIRNTVKRAQETARALETVFGNEHVELFHSQYLSNDRMRKESKLRAKLGKNGKRPSVPYIVVGTQVLEQSLDIDFDLMITDIAPIDLLLQRMGRLHRHTRDDRPEKLRIAKCLITGVDVLAETIEFTGGSEAIYGRYLLLVTYLRLHMVKSIVLPIDIPELVQDVYQRNGIDAPKAWEEALQASKDKHEERIRGKEIRARDFRINEARATKSLLGWLSASVSDSEAQGEATVRDASDSLEVIIVYKNRGGRIHLLPWIADHPDFRDSAIPTDCAPGSELAQMVAECTVRLPAILCTPWLIDKVINELESSAWPYVSAWQESPWLKGMLVLILDEGYKTELCGYRIKYEEKWGLSAERGESTVK